MNAVPIADADLEKLLLIRHFEKTLLNLFSKGKLNGTTHTCLGQEIVPVAINAFAQEHDFHLSNHRGHGHYLARFDDPAGLFAEIMGREGAVCSGVGGSQHVYRDQKYLSTGIQGESMPVAAGIAMTLKKRKPGAIALAYIGDGTWGEGPVYEALNMAKLWSLPLVVVVENNEIAQTTPRELQMAGTIEARVAAFGVRYLKSDAADLVAVRALIEAPIAETRAKSDPLVIEFAVDRLGPHSKGDDTRPEALIASLKERDWYARYRAIDPARFDDLERRVLTRLEMTLAEVDARPASKWELK
jgi:acetoin:2,6-dichlorophenolindophenol oxidoreductase subunit alpha